MYTNIGLYLCDRKRSRPVGTCEACRNRLIPFIWKPPWRWHAGAGTDKIVIFVLNFISLIAFVGWYINYWSLFSSYYTDVSKRMEEKNWK